LSCHLIEAADTSGNENVEVTGSLLGGKTLACPIREKLKVLGECLVPLAETA